MALTHPVTNTQMLCSNNHFCTRPLDLELGGIQPLYGKSMGGDDFMVKGQEIQVEEIYLYLSKYIQNLICKKVIFYT